jgi:hypothetical protein
VNSEHSIDRHRPAAAGGLFEEDGTGASDGLLDHFKDAGERAAGEDLAAKCDESEQDGIAAVGDGRDMEDGCNCGGDPGGQGESQFAELEEEKGAFLGVFFRCGRGDQIPKFLAVSGGHRPIEESEAIGLGHGVLSASAMFIGTRRLCACV